MVWRVCNPRLGAQTVSRRVLDSVLQDEGTGSGWMEEGGAQRLAESGGPGEGLSEPGCLGVGSLRSLAVGLPLRALATSG